MSENTGILLETKDLSKYFTEKKGLLNRNPSVVKAVDHVSLSVRKGETLGLVGESGCGKSTLGRTILRLIPATEGQVMYNGEDILTYDKKKMWEMRRKLQIIFQDPYSSLNPRMTVYDLISAPLEVYKFVVCDEAVSALDVSVRAQVLNLMRNMQQKKNLTYLFISHDLSVVRHISDRIAVMYLGSVVEVAEKAQLYSNPMHPYTKALLSAIPLPDVKKKRQRIILEGYVPSAYNPPSGCKFHTRCPYATDRCRQEAPVLQEVEKGHKAACHRALELA